MEGRQLLGETLDEVRRAFAQGSLTPASAAAAATPNDAASEFWDAIRQAPPAAAAAAAAAAPTAPLPAAPGRLPSLARSKSMCLSKLGPAARDGGSSGGSPTTASGHSRRGPQRSTTLPPLGRKALPPLQPSAQQASGAGSRPESRLGRWSSSRACLPSAAPARGSPMAGCSMLQGEESRSPPAVPEEGPEEGLSQAVAALELDNAGMAPSPGSAAAVDAPAPAAEEGHEETAQLRGSLTARVTAAAQQWKSLEDFSALRRIAQTTHSTVWEAVPRRGDQKDLTVAIKAYHLAALGRHELARVALEQRLLCTLRHPHLIRGHGAFCEGGHLFLVMELAGGASLAAYLAGWQRRSRDDFEAGTTVVPEAKAAAHVVAPLLDALAYLHAAGVVHRDIKPANAVFDSVGRLRLLDLGLALDTRCAAEAPCCLVGTRTYMAPELLGEHPPPLDLVDRTDVWAVGVVAFQLLAGQLPWSSPVPAALYQALREEPVPLGPLRAVRASAPATAFILQALEKDPARRPAAEQLRAHPWLLQHVGGQEDGGARFSA